MLVGVDIENYVAVRSLSWPWVAAPVPNFPDVVNYEVIHQLQLSECRSQGAEFMRVVMLESVSGLEGCFMEGSLDVKFDPAMLFGEMFYSVIHICLAHKSNTLSIKQKCTNLWSSSEQDIECLLCSLDSMVCRTKAIFSLFTKTHALTHTLNFPQAL